MADLATAYVQIIPSAEGIKGRLTELLGGEAETAGRSAGSKLGGIVGGTMKTVASAGIAAVGAASAAMGAFGKEAVGVGMNFDSAMSQVAATMGYSVEELNTQGSEASETYNKLRQFAQEMGSATAFSASEAADALNYMALAGYDADTSMQMLPNVLNLAAAGGIDLASASDMVTDAQSALGLSLAETSTMVDQMAAASSKSNTSVAQLGEAFLTIGATARNLSGGTQELSTMLGVLADNGIKGAEGGTHLRNMILSLQSPTDTGAALLEQLGVAVYGADGNMRSLIDIVGDLQTGMEGMDQASKDAVIGGIFNKTDLASVNALVGTSSERFAELGDVINNASFNMQDIENALVDSGVAWEQYADLAWMAGGEGISDLTDQIIYNVREQGLSVAETADFIASEYDMSMDDAVKAVKSVSEALDETKGAAENMANTQLDNLSGDVTLFQSALEGAKIAVSDKLTPTLREFVQLGSSGLGTVTEAFREGGLEGAMGAAGEWLSTLVRTAVDYLPMIVAAALQLIGAFGQGLIDNLPLIMSATMEIMGMIFSGIVGALPDIFTSATSIILTLIQGITGSIPDLIPTALSVVMAISDGIIENLPLILEAGLELLLAVVSGIVDNLDQLVFSVLMIISKIVTTLIEHLPQLLDTGFQLILGLIKGLVKAIPDLIMAIPMMIAAIVDGFINVDWPQVGNDILSGIGSGIKAGAQKLVDSAKQVAKDALDGVKNFLGIHSPSRVFRDEVGKMLDLGLAEGLEQNTAPIQKAMEGVAELTEEPLTAKVRGMGAVAGGIRGNMDLSQNPALEDLLELVMEIYELLMNRKENITVSVNLRGKEIRREIYNAEDVRDLRNGGR